MKERKVNGYKIAIAILIIIVFALASTYYYIYNTKISLPDRVNNQISKIDSISNNINNAMTNYPNISSSKFNEEENTLLYVKNNLTNDEKNTATSKALLKEEKLYADFSQYSSDYCEVQNKLKNIYKETNGFTYNDILNVNEIISLKNSIKSVLNSKELNEMINLYSNKELNRIITYKETPQEIKNKLTNLLNNLSVSRNYEEISNLEANTMSPTYKNNTELDNSKIGYAEMNMELKYELGYNKKKDSSIIEKYFNNKILKGTVGGKPAIFDFTHSNYQGGNEIGGIQIINGVKEHIYK